MRSTPCSGKALRTVCSGSVRGGSKVGRARAAEGAAQCQTPPPRTAGALRCSLVAPPPRAGPLAACRPSRASLEWGGGGSPSGCVRCCWPSYCSAVGHGIKALRGRCHRGKRHALKRCFHSAPPPAQARRLRGLDTAPLPLRLRLRSALQRGRSVQRIQHSGGGFYVGVGFCGSGVAWCAVVFGSFSVARWRGRGSVRRSGGGGALGCSLSLARVPVPHAGGGVPCGGGGVCAFRGVPWGSALPCGVVGVAGSRLAVVSSGSPSVPGHAVI